MAEELRSREREPTPPTPVRQAVREPERLDRGVDADRPDRKVGDKIHGEGRGEEGGVERRDERAPNEPAEGPREPQEPRTTHVDRGGE